MTSQLLDMTRARPTDVGDLPGLRAALTSLVGEPFRFARVSYGDELTLHFGDLRPARSAKLKKHLYGAYLLGARASAWLLKAGVIPLVRSYGLGVGSDPTPDMTPLDKADIETKPLVEPGSRVLSADPFPVRPADRYGLELRFSDGSALRIIPTPDDPTEETDDLPALADWELSTPNGLLSAGPGLTWGFQPRKAEPVSDTSELRRFLDV